MDVLLHLNNELSSQVKSIAKYNGKSIDTFILKVLENYVSNIENKIWKQEIINFQGVPDLIPFENYRNELLEPKDDPFV
jgi:hypothetical protein